MKQLLYCLFIIQIISCKNHEVPKSTFRTLVTDTSVSHRQRNEIDISKSRCTTFNLPFIHTGVDSFEVRVWSTPSMWTPGYFTILRHYISKLYKDPYAQWEALEYEYYGSLDSMKVRKIEINDSIAQTIKAYLTEDSILSFPSQDAIPNFVDNSADGESYTIEIASSNFYKAIRYSNPKMHAKMKHEPNHMKMVRILEFLSKNLKVVYYPF